ncbi:MAG: acylamino acid-releasing protein, partial [Planctomycetaceae bacterium]|nr:acylamino acid-releasing protein [Planctomycetaceae bacterium]
MNLLRRSRTFLFFFACSLLASGLLQAADLITADPRLPETTPWDLKALSQAPSFEWVDQTSPVRSLIYQGLEYRG